MGIISFGLALVAGRNRVPRPATGNTALVTFFMVGYLIRFIDDFKIHDSVQTILRHSRERGNPSAFGGQRHWIPAFAGMTNYRHVLRNSQ
jgi:hypothetical protein